MSRLTRYLSVTSCILVLSSTTALLAADVKAQKGSATKQAASQKAILENSKEMPKEAAKGAQQPAAPIAAQSVFKSFTGKVSGKRVRMRIAPDMGAHVVRELTSSDLLLIEGESSDFYQVRPPKDIKAYVFRTFVLDNIVEGANVNVRLEPHLEAPVIAQLHTGDSVQGSVSPINSKWLEITPPASTHFFIAKDYISFAGDENYLATMEQRCLEVNHLLNSAYLIGQSELRKPFEQVDFDRVAKGFTKVIERYSDFPEQVAKAHQVLDSVKETYLQKKIAFLEARAQESTVATQAEITKYQEQLAHLEKQLKMGLDESMRAPGKDSSAGKAIATVPSKATPPAGAKQSTTTAQKAIEKKAAEQRLTEQMADALSPSIAGADEADVNLPWLVTEKMLAWQPLEESLYRTWARKHGERGISDFYVDESLNATTLTGVIEAYDQGVKNRPGNYILKQNNVPIAYLYSTKINLAEKIGHEVILEATPRSNNNFAFPAYYVLGTH